ncbi:PVC-type heme-binding CxxCH protein [Tuwongella immobilis]|uniref:Cytochrome c domain-containing protein n=1 Tax=Tuwongella immobilis TaxID=692036 RepID=A0A6C2YT13_9BACT|nr:PVC-type heme-binding CxxCH protein [Tuwongella immobilis]VIP04022.1 l-sorbosone dehydrogenase : Putative membrane-bound dehydrogenase OS=Singulisphaera acidiphila (strain ATCC BAA-1392 / DSM 18658 / VKM B-2454 / MOB10) GN=Sinac_6954 PE=4 SV=1: Cytochrom_C [Tuwongella immobilis]VTS05411.1 l-sorbosone dehydrogenase : Putative membrane-bound dehydrogenase OS=Singulisphaera acidiphila (strain ATCC BAA-1392 / DSM 18658 / VKM B-2454 / MOB10) GN=Sinac_6954 PE=4 SV=1: Cytochrom_C [Tuwongella immobili
MVRPACLLGIAGLLLAIVPPAMAQNLTPQQAIARMKTLPGYEVRLVAAEPDVRQPVSISFDSQGRMWVLQYLQYPNPAGLKAVKQDQYLRTIWDRVPEPPPRGPKGADKLTILSDPDEHGHYRKAKDFLTGLNLATGFALGRDGVYVVQAPYLLFYPDRNHDDQPDGDPEVLLTGFGMEDSHAYANSLQWGPDGWLYGAQGSTVTANIRGIEFQQGIWRYHPETKVFELFSEGGGNTYGLDFDRAGRVIAGTNWGGKAMLHQVQGAYYIKGFGKHGPLHNPHAYGYFDHVPQANFKGGHVTCGGVLVMTDRFPQPLQGQYVAGNLLSNDVYLHTLQADGSSFKATQGADFLVSNDPWFRPIDCLVGPDGGIYVVDWHDKRAAHLDPVDTWDRTNGRVYKVVPKGNQAEWKSPDLAKLPASELLKWLGDANIWKAREARRILTDRRDQSILPNLLQLVRSGSPEQSLEAMWTIYGIGGLPALPSQEMLQHPNEHIRTWMIRLLGDTHAFPTDLHPLLHAIAERDPSPTVRSQLACSLKRISDIGIRNRLLASLLQRKDDLQDPYIPMLLWWVLEDQSIREQSETLAVFADRNLWTAPIVEGVILERIARRYLAEGTESGYAACARLLELAPSPAATDRLIVGMEKALDGRRLAKVPASLEQPLASLRKSRPNNALLRFAVRLGSQSALQEATDRLQHPSCPESEQIALLELIAQGGDDSVLPILLGILHQAKTDPLRLAVLRQMQAFNQPVVPETMLAMYDRSSRGLRSAIITALLARPASTISLLKRIDSGKINKSDLTLDQLRQVMSRSPSPEIVALIDKQYGKVGAEPTGEKQARIAYLGIAMRRNTPNLANGETLFRKNCMVCHQLHNEGNKIGPDLTTADRGNLGFLLLHIVDPSASIRSEYVAWNIATVDGRLLTGLLVDQSPASITLLDAQNQRTLISRDKIEEMTASTVSLMPEKLLDSLSEQEAVDLLTYVQQAKPKPR